MRLNLPLFQRTSKSLLLSFFLVLGVVEAFAQENESAPRVGLFTPKPNYFTSKTRLPILNGTRFGNEPGDRISNDLSIQLMLPVRFKHFDLLTRTVFQVLDRPIGLENRKFGLGDTNPQFMFTTKKKQAVSWAIGPAFLIPTATHEFLGFKRFCMGPSISLAVYKEKWLIGTFAENLWSVGNGSSDRNDINVAVIQSFFYYQLPKEWYLTSIPIISVNWKGPEGGRWRVPVGGGFGKKVVSGPVGVRFQVASYYFVSKLEPTRQKWSIQSSMIIAFATKAEREKMKQ